MGKLNRLIEIGERIASHLADLLSAQQPVFPQQSAIAYRWLSTDQSKQLQPVLRPHQLSLNSLLCIDRQREIITRNTQQFLQGLPANNALLWGSRGTGKSSLIKAILNEFSDQGLRLIEVSKEHLVDLAEITQLLADRDEKFILYCDDLSFEANDPSYKALKAALDGSIINSGENLLIYATSNRRHLLPEFMDENQMTRHDNGEIHYADVVEEKISLSERFGLWVSFHPFTQNQYLEIVDHWIDANALQKKSLQQAHREALTWALSRGSRSGRVAKQFANDWNARQHS